MAKVGNGGFTLVEITMVLAIAAGLGLVTFAGFSLINQQLRFSSGIEKTKDFITTQRTEVLSGIQVQDDEKVGTRPFINLGRVLELDGDTIKVETVRMNDQTAPSAGERVDVVDGGGNNLVYKLPAGAEFTGGEFAGGKRQIAFIRSPADGTLQTFISGGGGFAAGPVSKYRFASFNSPPADAVSFQIKDDRGRAATITVDPKTNSISRTFE